jgi:hypothetical protein
VTCDVGLTYDLIDESFYSPIIVTPIILLVALPLLPHLLVMLSLVMPYKLLTMRPSRRMSMSSLLP